MLCGGAQAAAKTNDTAGDGTTTATILSAAIIAEGMKIVAAGANPVQLTRGIERTVAELVKKLQKSSTEVTDEGLADVATVSAGNNRVVRHRAYCHGLCGPTHARDRSCSQAQPCLCRGDASVMMLTSETCKGSQWMSKTRTGAVAGLPDVEQGRAGPQHLPI